MPKSLQNSIRLCLLLFPNTQESDYLVTKQTTEEDISRRVKNMLREKTELFDSLKKLYPAAADQDGKIFIPQELEIDEQGNLLGELPEKEFSQKLFSFVRDPQHRFSKYVLDSALKTKSFAQDPSQDYITSFGAQNLGEYLQYLQTLRLALADSCESLTSYYRDNNDLDKLTNPAFFHNFLLKFNKDRTKFETLFESPNNSEFSEEILLRKTPEKSAAELKFTRNLQKFEHDFTAEKPVGNLRVCYSETIGARSTQEDALVIGTAISNDSKAWPHLLQKEFRALGEKIRKIESEYSPPSRSSAAPTKQGSTAIVATYCSDRTVTIANCGDSRAVMFFQGSDGEVEYLRLTNDHKPDNIFEKARIENDGGMVTNGRAQGVLAVARGFGDSICKIRGTEKFASSFEPDIFQYSLKESGDSQIKAFLLVSCDGLYETASEKNYAADLQNWFRNASNIQSKFSGNLAEYIRDCAILRDSSDNVTVCITDITETPTEPITIGVFDGHGGSKISQTLAVEFGKSFLSQEMDRVIYPLEAESVIAPEPELSTQSEASTVILDSASADILEETQSKKRPLEEDMQPSTTPTTTSSSNIKKIARTNSNNASATL